MAAMKLNSFILMILLWSRRFNGRLFNNWTQSRYFVKIIYNIFRYFRWFKLDMAGL